MKYIAVFFLLLIISSCGNDVINNNGNGNPVSDFDIYLSRFIPTTFSIRSYTIKSDGSNLRLLNDSLYVTSASYKNKITMANIDSSGFFCNLLYTANSDGTNLVKIPRGSYYPVYFILSPNGDKVLFTTDAGNYLCVINIDGTGLIQLSDGIRGTEIVPKFSPDGRLIAFFEAPPNLSTGLYTISTDGSNKKLLKDSIHYSNNYTLDWSPDGSKIVYQNNIGTLLPAKICTVDTSGTAYNEITNGQNPSFSPNGKKITYLANVNQGIYDLFVMNSDGSGIANLTNSFSEYDHEGAWSGDGSKILYHSGSYLVKIYDMDLQLSRILTDSLSGAFWKY